MATLPIPLLDLPAADARRACDSGAPVCVLVNPVEYHGPHLSLHNDRLVSQGLVRDVHAGLAARHPAWPLLIGADLDVGVDPSPGPGTVDVGFAVVKARVLEACRALHALGARRVVFVTFHGSPMHAQALEAGVRWLAERAVPVVNPFNAAMRTLLESEGAMFTDAYAHVTDPEVRAALVRGQRFDLHAGFLETSMALHYAPTTVSPALATVPPCPAVPRSRMWTALADLARRAGRRGLAAELDLVAFADGWWKLRPFPGYTGSPHLASAAAGAAFTRAMLPDLVSLCEDVLAGRAASPPPVLAWLGALTLGGRLKPPVRHPRFDAD